MEIKTFNIPASKKTAVEHQLGKFNARAIKMNMLPLSCSWGKAFDNDGILCLPLEVSGDLSVTFKDWEFVVSLQHLQTGENIIRSLDKSFHIEDKYRSGNGCEHCQVKRYRKETYLLRHINGEVIQVGSSCIKDFLGGNSPEDILKKACLIAELNSYLEGSATGGTGGDIVFPIVEFLANACAIIREFGWVSKAKAVIGSGQTSTATRVLDNLIPYPGVQVTPFTADDLNKANLISLWAEDLTDKECEESSYFHNLRAIARSGLVGMRTIGFAASMVQAYDKSKKLTSLFISTPNLNYVGCINDKCQYSLTLKSDISFYSPYGETHLYIFNDDNQNVLVWKSSKDNHLEINKRYEVKGTIKAHNNYKGTPQTQLTRCKILSTN